MRRNSVFIYLQAVSIFTNIALKIAKKYINSDVPTTKTLIVNSSIVSINEYLFVHALVTYYTNLYHTSFTQVNAVRCFLFHQMSRPPLRAYTERVQRKRLLTFTPWILCAWSDRPGWVFNLQTRLSASKQTMFLEHFYFSLYSHNKHWPNANEHTRAHVYTCNK